MKNQPYVKQIENGIVTNPIKDGYYNEYPNRKARRAKKYGERHMSNKKGIKLSIFESMKYKRIFQILGDRVIKHYIAVVPKQLKPKKIINSEK